MYLLTYLLTMCTGQTGNNFHGVQTILIICRHFLLMCGVMCGFQADRTLSLGVIPCQYRRKWYIAETRFVGLHFCRREYGRIFNHFYVIRPESYRIRWNYAEVGLLRSSRSFKVTDFDTNRKLICDFLLVMKNYCDLPPILHRFRDSLGKVQNRYFGYTSSV